MTRRLFRRAASLRSPPRETRWYTAGVAQLALLVVARQYVARAIALSGGESHWRQAGITAARLTFDALVFLCATDVDYRRSAVHFASPTGLHEWDVAHPLDNVGQARPLIVVSNFR